MMVSADKDRVKLGALADLNKSQTRSSQMGQCRAVLRFFFPALTDLAEVSFSSATVASSGEEMETVLIVADAF